MNELPGVQCLHNPLAAACITHKDKDGTSLMEWNKEDRLQASSVHHSGTHLHVSLEPLLQ